MTHEALNDDQHSILWKVKVYTDIDGDYLLLWEKNIIDGEEIRDHDPVGIFRLKDKSSEYKASEWETYLKPIDEGTEIFGKLFSETHVTQVAEWNEDEGYLFRKSSRWYQWIEGIAQYYP